MAEIRRPLIVDAGRRRVLAASEVLPGASIDQIAGLAPTLDLDFERQIYRHYTPALGLREKALSDIVTFTRASSATYLDAKGQMQLAGSNEHRIDFDQVTGVCRGLLIEESRTNLFINSLLNGTNLTTQTVTVTAAAHTISFYGTGSITLSGAHSATITGTADSVRTSLTFTPTAESLVCTVSGTVKLAQCELGSFATSFIPTTGSTAIRSADAAKVDGTAFSDMWSSSESTILLRFNAPVYNALSAILRVNDGTTNNFIQPLRFTSANTLNLTASADGVTQYANAQTATYVPGVNGRVAMAVKVRDYGTCFNGSEFSASSSYPQDYIPSVVNRLETVLPKSIYIQQITVFPRRLSNVTLQQLTA